MIDPAAGTAEAAQVPRRVGVVGGGRMGSGIAHAFLVRGSSVTLIEADADRVGAAENGVIRAIEQSVRRGAVDEPADAIAARLEVRTDVAALAGSALTVEAVPEIPDLKHRVLQTISATVGPDALIASNTSSLSISELARHVEAPERFLGLHFFNPVPASQLVEVVVGSGTAEATTETARRIVGGLGKAAITVADSPGFASSRLGVLLGLEAIRMVEQQVATPEDIDTAMTLGYQHPIGPLRLTDLVGLDVRLDIADYLARTLGDRFAPPQLLRDMVARGDLGRKTGRGFYDWPAGG
jgi:3-hydroxybutyryl-CoA dehydrogenase